MMVGNFLSAHGFARGVCEELSPRLEQAGWRVHTTSSQLLKPMRMSDMLSTAWLRRFDYDIAHVDLYSGPAFHWAEAVCWLFRRLNKPFVLTLHGGGLPAFAARNPERVRKLLNFAAAVTAPSPYLQEQMAPYRKGLILLPNGLDIAAYRWRKRQPVKPNLIWLRAFHLIYDPTMAVRVMARLKFEFPDAHLTMTGADKGDQTKQQTVALAEETGTRPMITFQDPVRKNEVPKVLDHGDIFLNTSAVDNTPVTVLEALAAGLCVVSTNPGGIPYLLRSGEHAQLVASGDDAAMALAVRNILRDQKVADHLQDTSHAFVQQFDWSRVLPQWTVLLTSILEGRRPTIRLDGAREHVAAREPQFTGGHAIQ